MSTLTARRLVLPGGEVAELCRRLGLTLPPGLVADVAPVTSDEVLIDGCVHPAVAAGLAATCSPEVAVLVSTSLGSEAAFGIAGELGGGLIRFLDSDVELSAWPALRLGAELARGVPPLPSHDRPSLHAPLQEIAALPSLRAVVCGVLRATVVAPPTVLGQVVWLATADGWLALEPAEVRAGVRWATVRPVEPGDLGPAVAPFVAAALA